MILDGIILALIIAFLRGGSFKGFDEIKFKHGAVIVVLFLLQLVLFILAPFVNVIAVWLPVWLMTFYGVLVILGWMNRHIPGFSIMVIGILMNMIVMIANGGKMPVSVEAINLVNPEAMNDLFSGAIKHIPMDSNTRLWFLGDIIPLTSPYPNKMVISLGDVFLNVGGFLFVWKTMSKYKRKVNIGGEVL